MSAVELVEGLVRFAAAPVDGTTSDLSAVSAALDRAVSGRATRIAICGATGTGRTRLIEHARDDAERVSMRVLATHGRSTDVDIPYASMLTLLHPVTDRIPDLPATERDSLEAALDLRADDVDPRAARTGLWRLLTRLGEECPLLITVDDSHLMDAASLDVLAFALGRMDAQPVAALATADCHRAPNPLLAIGDEVIILDDPDVDAVARAVRATVSATDHVIRRMMSFAGGDRALTVQLVSALTADQRAGRAPCPAVPAVPTAQVLALDSMLQPLDRAARDALALVAADTTDDVDMVRSALRALGHAGDPLAELERLEHVALVGSGVSVRRPLLHALAYHRLEPALRRNVHAALATAMTAPHLEAARAWQLAEAAAGPGADVAEAMSGLARAAAARGDLRVAAVTHERAAELAERHDERSASVAAALGLWTSLGDPIAMRRLLGAGGHDIPSRIARSAAARWLDGDAAAVAELRAAAPGAGDRERSLLDALFADAAFASGHVREATETARQLVRRNAGGAGRQLAEAVLALAGDLPVASLTPVDVAGAGLAETLVADRAALRQAEAHLLHGDTDAAELALGGAHHNDTVPWDPAERVVAHARVAIAQGHPTTAHRLLQSALDTLPAGAVLPRAVLRVAQAEAQFLMGDGEAAMATLDEMVPILHGAGMSRVEASAHRTVGRIAWSVDQTDVAIACLERARRIDPAAPTGELVALLASLGRDHDATAWLAKIDRRPGDPSVPIDVLRARCSAASRPEPFDQLADLLRHRHLVVAEVELMIDLAAWHHRRARWSDVYRAAEHAARLLIPSGIKAWIERLDQLEPPADAPTGGVPDLLVPLTEAERRVAMAVSRGISNREVAAELFLSIKTVDSHLQRIYPKLQIRSRAELAALVNAAVSSASGGSLGSPTGNLPDAWR